VDTLNLGILAHVDAGKTTLTERLLYEAGAIDRIGSVDEGTTQTDTLALERERGITIKSGVVSFAVGDLAVNVIDTPGHPDFIAEVERALRVLDGAVLVVSAVEGVQAQTPLLMRALQRLNIPTLIFVNKIDRRGANDDAVLETIRKRLSSLILPMGTSRYLGTAQADFVAWNNGDVAFHNALMAVLAERDNESLAAYLDDVSETSYGRLRGWLADQTRQVRLYPVFFGSAATGAGVAALTEGIAELLPRADANMSVGSTAGRIFKIERTATSERIAFVRLFSGTLRVRDSVRHGEKAHGRVTKIEVVVPGSAERRASLRAGEIGRVWGLRLARVGDTVGEPTATELTNGLPLPALEAVVIPRDPSKSTQLGAALKELAEQDPLIDVRHEQESGDLLVSLYGEVQKEVLGATLTREYSVDVEFRETRTVYVERPAGRGEAVEVLRARTNSSVTGKSSPHTSNPYPATLGLRVEPGQHGSGV
jgi:ribosomal protection tetracycline resistance protein